MSPIYASILEIARIGTDQRFRFHGLVVAESSNITGEHTVEYVMRTKSGINSKHGGDFVFWCPSLVLITMIRSPVIAASWTKSLSSILSGRSSNKRWKHQTLHASDRS
ncbi:unnamed protein product [Laminaria digitata]